LEKERLLVDLNTLRQWKDSAQASINALSIEAALNAVPEGGNQIDNVIAKLSGIREELRRRDDQLVQAKSETEALLRKGEEQKRQPQQQQLPPPTPPPSAGTVVGGAFLARNIVPNVNVIGSGFSSRKKNVAEVRKNIFTSSSSPQVSGGVVTPPKTSAPSTFAGASPQSSNTVSAYDATLVGAQGEQIAMADTGKGVTATLPSTPTAAAATSAQPRSSGTMSAYDAALAAMQQEKATPPPPTQAAADEYRKAEKQLLTEAKALAEVAARSFEEAKALKGGWNKKKYNDVLARAYEERARVDELLSEANGMKEKADQQGSVGP